MANASLRPESPADDDIVRRMPAISVEGLSPQDSLDRLSFARDGETPVPLTEYRSTLTAIQALMRHTQDVQKVSAEQKQHFATKLALLHSLGEKIDSAGRTDVPAFANHARKVASLASALLGTAEVVDHAHVPKGPEDFRVSQEVFYAGKMRIVGERNGKKTLTRHPMGKQKYDEEIMNVRWQDVRPVPIEYFQKLDKMVGRIVSVKSGFMDIANTEVPPGPYTVVKKGENFVLRGSAPANAEYVVAPERLVPPPKDLLQ